MGFRTPDRPAAAAVPADRRVRDVRGVLAAAFRPRRSGTGARRRLRHERAHRGDPQALRLRSPAGRAVRRLALAGRARRSRHLVAVEREGARPDHAADAEYDPDRDLRVCDRNAGRRSARHAGCDARRLAPRCVHHQHRLARRRAAELLACDPAGRRLVAQPASVSRRPARACSATTRRRASSMQPCRRWRCPPP